MDCEVTNKGRLLSLPILEPVCGCTCTQCSFSRKMDAGIHVWQRWGWRWYWQCCASDV